MLVNDSKNTWITCKLSSLIFLLPCGFFNSIEFLGKHLLGSEDNGLALSRMQPALGPCRKYVPPNMVWSSSNSKLQSQGTLIYNIHLSCLKITFSWLQSRVPNPHDQSEWILTHSPAFYVISSSFLSLPNLIYIPLNIFPPLYGLQCWLGQDQGQCQVVTSHFSRLTGYSYLTELLLMQWLRSQPSIMPMVKLWGAQGLCWYQDDGACGESWGTKQESCY